MTNKKPWNEPGLRFDRDLDDDEPFPMQELEYAIRTGKCPFCGASLIAIFDAVGEGLRCPNGDWMCGLHPGMVI